MLVAGAAVGVATVFAAPFSGEMLPSPRPLPRNLGLLHSRLTSSLCPVEESRGGLGANFGLGSNSSLAGTGWGRVGVQTLRGYHRETWG